MGQTHFSKLAWLAALCAGIVVAGGFFYLSLERPSPESVAKRYLADWKSGHDEPTIVAAAQKRPMEAHSNWVEMAVSEIRFESLGVTGSPVTMEDSSLVPATARIEGPPTARGIASHLPMTPDSAAIDKLSSALDRPFAFNVAVVKEKGEWKVDEETTRRSLVEAVGSDRKVHDAIFGAALSMLPDATRRVGSAVSEAIKQFTQSNPGAKSLRGRAD